ncbi:RICIN domain-containing protein [Nucisporomicrobium flavum]|uniref:RICIN domain-containing protein n=1 Tax=Nucisporomicrobium flavum TaxID=2785915 RepID=UPI0018F5AE3C|nr:RICIN domain-containing protein [Nucisporomicrobium flavum]
MNAGTGAVLVLRDVAADGDALTWRWAPDDGVCGPWQPADMGDGTQQLRELRTGRLLGDAGPRAQAWWFVPDGRRGIEHAATGVRLGGPDCSWEADYRVNGCFQLRNAETGSVLGQLWRLRYGGAGTFRIQNASTGQVLGLTRAERIVETGDGTSRDRLWRFH